MKSKITILIIIFLFVNLSGCSNNFKLGNSEYSKGNYEKAVEYYSLHLQKHSSPEAYNNRGNAYIDLKKYNEAIADFTKALELKPDYAEAYLNRGTVYDELKKYNEAIADYSKAIELKPDYDLAYNDRGLTYYHLQKYEEAIDDYKKTIQINPFSQATKNNIGYAYLCVKDYVNADYNFKNCLELDSVYYNAMIGISLICFDKLGNEDTKMWMKKALALEPKLNEGMTGIEKLEKEGWEYTAEQKENLKKIFEMMGK